MRWRVAVPFVLFGASLALGGCFGGYRVQIDCYHRTIQVQNDTQWRLFGGPDMQALAAAMDRCDMGTRDIDRNRRP